MRTGPSGKVLIFFRTCIFQPSRVPRAVISYFSHKLHILNFVLKKKSSDSDICVGLWTFLKLKKIGNFGVANFSLLWFWDFSFKILNEKSQNQRREKLATPKLPIFFNFKKVHSPTQMSESLDFFFKTKFKICSLWEKYEITALGTLEGWKMQVRKKINTFPEGPVRTYIESERS